MPTGTASHSSEFARAAVVFGLANTLDTRDDMSVAAAFFRAHAHLPLGHVVPLALGASLAVCGAVACGARSPAVPPTASIAPRSEAERAEELPRSDARICFQMVPSEAEPDLPARLLRGSGYWAVTGTYLDCRWGDSGERRDALLQFTRVQDGLRLFAHNRKYGYRLCDTAGEVHAHPSGLLISASPRESTKSSRCQFLHSDLSVALDLTRGYAIHGDCIYLLDALRVPLLELSPVQDPTPTVGRDLCPDFHSLTNWPAQSVPKSPGAREVANAVRAAADPGQGETGQRRLAAACAAGSVEACVASSPLPRPTVDDPPFGLDPGRWEAGWPARNAAQIAQESWPDWPPVKCTSEPDWAEDCTVVMHPYCAGYLPIRAAERLDLYACLRAGCTCTAPASLEQQVPPRLQWAREAPRWQLMWLDLDAAETPTSSPVRLEIAESPGPTRPGWLRLSPLGLPWEPSDPYETPPAVSREMQFAEWILAQSDYRTLRRDDLGRVRVHARQYWLDPQIAVGRLNGSGQTENVQ